MHCASLYDVVTVSLAREHNTAITIVIWLLTGRLSRAHAIILVLEQTKRELLVIDVKTRFDSGSILQTCNRLRCYGRSANV